MSTPQQQENLKAWVAALRSGKYKQTKCALWARDGGSFCCLGVACDIYPYAEWEGGTFLGRVTVLPPDVQGWLGINLVGGLPRPAYSRGSTTLISLNDSGSTFDQIADVIEEKLIK